MMIQCGETSARSPLKLALAAVVLGSTSSPTAAQDAVPPVIELRQAETLGIGTSPSKAAMAKMGADLMALHAEYQAHLARTSRQGAAAPAFKSSNTLPPIAEGAVVIDTAASGDPESLAADLRALGAENVTVFGRLVSARFPITAIPALEGLSSLQFARPAYATTNSGAVTSQGDRAMGADIARITFDVDGTGVLVGTLSDSFNCLGGAAAGVASGDLPAGITVLEEGPCADGRTDEGRGMMEIIHDIAPGTTQAFHTAEGGQANFAQGIIELANAGARVINDDIIYFREPMFQDGPIAQAVDQVKALGVSYFSAAGNDARTSYESPFRPSGTFLNIGFGAEEAHDFDPGAGVGTCQQITIPLGRTLRGVYQWDQPFFSVSGPPGSASDMDIVLTNAACTTILAVSADGNLGGDPAEDFSFFNAGPTTTFGIIILQFSGPDPGLMKTVLIDSGRTSQITIDEFATKIGTSWGHSAALGGLGVGAADSRQTPAFNTSPPVIETFSSAGGTPILFDTAGNRLVTPEDRQQPDITAPDGTDTTFFGSDTDGTGFPNFFGTSAAAPHAAALTALMIDLNSSIGPDAVYSVLKTTAVDMDDPATMAVFDTGFDCRTGFGLIQAEDALGASLEPPPLPPPPAAAGCFVTPLQPLPPPPPPILCNGLPATIVGTDGDDHLAGKSRNDVIHGLAGNDTIAGVDGNDVICGGPGRDRLSGNRGNDKLFGGAGKDVLKGGAGTDRLFGQNGNDAMDGQSGSDRCNGGSGNDTAASCESAAGVP